MKKSYLENHRKVRAALNFMRLSGAALFLLFSILAFVSWILGMTYDPAFGELAPWHLWMRHLNAAAVLYFLPRGWEILKQESAGRLNR